MSERERESVYIVLSFIPLFIFTVLPFPVCYSLLWIFFTVYLIFWGSFRLSISKKKKRSFLVFSLSLCLHLILKYVAHALTSELISSGSTLPALPARAACSMANACILVFWGMVHNKSAKYI